MRSTAKFAASFMTFVIALLLTNVAAATIWEKVVSQKLYDCTDSVGFDYVLPGRWVHAPVAVVPQVVHNRSMSEPDTIREGWTVRKLWALWWSLVAGSVIISLLLASWPWILCRRMEPRDGTRLLPNGPA
jgi:hypothetical protein